jgi:hypothetical protein
MWRKLETRGLSRKRIMDKNNESFTTNLFIAEKIPYTSSLFFAEEINLTTETLVERGTILIM